VGEEQSGRVFRICKRLSCMVHWWVGFTLTLHLTISHIVVDVHGALEMIVTN
jgi:hypothetical protein